MSFQAKVRAFSLSIGALAVLLAVVLATTVHLVVRDDERLGRVLRFGADVRKAEALASEILLGGSPRAYQQWSVLSASLRDGVADLGGLPFATAGLTDELSSRIDSMDRTFARLSTTANGADPVVRRILASRIQADKGALVSRVTSLEGEVREAQSASYRLAALANLAVIGCLLLLAVVHNLMMRRFLLGAWNALTQAIQTIDKGELTTPIASQRRDEVGGMLAALDGMRARLLAKIKAEDAARRAAEELSRAKSRFVASVSHELRTPLTGLLGLIDLAERRGDEAEIRRDLRGARAAGRHLLELVNQILDFSKIEANKLEIAAEPFDPDIMLKNVESIFAVQAAEKGLLLRLVSPAKRSPVLRGDQHRLTQILFNLVSNAIKFTDRGAVTVTYSVEPMRGGRWRLRIDVVDTGPGIPEAAKASIFDEFVQLQDGNSRRTVGTGLGLAICARLVMLMGGRIGIESAPVAGAHFFVVLDLPEAPPLTPAGDDSEPLRPVRPLSILIAEDVDINRMIVREILEAEGHRVEEAANGRQCVRMLAADPGFDVVLMDINMPEMDGIEATRAIRGSDAVWNRVPIVGLTANAFQQQTEGYIEAGMTACIAKPVMWAELLRTLAQVAGDRQPAAGAAALEPGERPLIDGQRLSDIERIMGAERLGNMIARSRSDLAEAADAAIAQIAEPEKLRATLHGLRGAAANLGCARLAEQALILERRAEAGEVDATTIHALPALVDDTIAEAVRWLADNRAA